MSKKRRGPIVNGVVHRCAEPTAAEDTDVPQCIGRAVCGKDSCTCVTWSKDQLADAEALKWSGDSERVLFEHVDWRLNDHFDRSRGVVRARLVLNETYREHVTAARAWIYSLSRAERSDILRRGGAVAAVPVPLAPPGARLVEP